jgi:hypothetical protein
MKHLKFMKDNFASLKLDQIRVASPCNARWEDMTGDERARFCGSCCKNVYNLSAMTRAEIVTLIHEKEGNFCGRFYRRHDGRLITADCSEGRRRRRNRVLQACQSAFAAVLVFLGLKIPANAEETGKAGRQLPLQSAAIMGDIAAPPIMGKISPPPATNKPSMHTNTPPVIMGEIAVPKETNVPVKRDK